MENENNPIVRAIDLGYGYTKYVKQITDKGEVIVDSFPSIAVPASVHSDHTASRKTVVIDVNGSQYEVGPDVYQASVNGASRTLDYTYAKTSAYEAMLRGALHFMNIDKLDLLVLGLPVSIYDGEEIGSFLKNKYTGRIEITPGSFIEIADVWILPQPSGGMFYYGSTNETYARIDGKNNLLIDPGYYTLDWYATVGVDLRLGTCGNTNGGVSSYLLALADQISKDTGKKLKDLQRLDNAVRMNEPVSLFGQSMSLDKYKPSARQSIESNVSEMVAKVGDGAYIDNIIIVGGGASLFYPEIQKRYPYHDIQFVKDGQFANVKGFQLAGEIYIAQ